MPRHKHADLMIAFANNNTLGIQFYNDASCVWLDTPNPVWDEDIEYRIKSKKADNGDFICEIDGVKWWLGPEAPHAMKWDGVKEWAEQQGCVLPPREVLLMCYIKEDIRKQFKRDWYWSGSEYSYDPADYAWLQSFGNGNQANYSKANSYYVRGVFCG